MKTNLNIGSKQAKYAVTIAALFLLTLLVQSSFVQGKSNTGTVPVVGAIIKLEKSGGGTNLKAETDNMGNFQITNAAKNGVYKMSITPAGTPPPAPFKAWANFKKTNGLVVAGIDATNGPTGQIAINSNGGTLSVSTSVGGTINGSLKK